jgi:ribonucleoside-diphosphate reductase alpha chain
LKRKKLANFRKVESIEVKINGKRLILSFNFLEQGGVGEVFINLLPHGSDLQTLLNCFAISISLNLQYGVPLEKLITLYRGVEFNPKGIFTGLEDEHEAKSIIDFLFTYLEENYLENQSDEAA